MAALTFDRALAIIGFILTIVLVVLDKAGKLRGPVLFCLLGVAAAMTVPLVFSIPWVSSQIGASLFSRRALTVCLVGTAYALLCVWVSSGSEEPKDYQEGGQKVSSAPAPSQAVSSSPSSTRPTVARPPTAVRDDPVGNLSRLGWTVKRADRKLVFEIANSPLPDMAESAAYFRQINEPFRLHFQSVSSLSGLNRLSGVEQCQEIEIGGSDLSDVSELAGFRGLKKLSMAQVPLNARNEIDIAPLGSMVNLESLNLYGSRVTSIESVRKLKQLTSLIIGGTLVRDLSPIKDLTTLKNVDVRDSKVVDLAPLAASRGLEELSIDGKQANTLRSLTSNVNLKKLTLIDQGFADLTPIGDLSHLEQVFVWGPRIMNLGFIRRLPNLTNVQISGLGFNAARSLVQDSAAICSSGNLSALTLVSLQLDSLGPLSGCAKLSEINLNSIPITSLGELAGIQTLRKISLVDIPVVEISPLLSLPNLESVYLIRVPARADVISELERRGVKVSTP